jgi:hypothetical protein
MNARSRNAALRCLLPAALLLVVSGGLALAATDKNPKPADMDFTPTRQVFDCTARDTLDLFAGLELSRPDWTTESPAELNSYGCRQWNEQGPENIYRLELASDLEVFAALRGFADPTTYPETDLDIFLLSDCDTDSCLAGENLEFSLPLAAGTYFLVVDGYGTSNAAADSFTLLLECRELGVPLEICAPGGAEAINPGTGTSDREGDLYQQPNLVQTFSCSPIVERGGEEWYAVTISPYHEFSVTMDPLSLAMDGALWLFDGCGPDAGCLAFADDKLSGEAETLGWVNDSEVELTVYLACDAYREVEDEFSGLYSLQFVGISNVSDTRKSFGSFRSMYR